MSGFAVRAGGAAVLVIAAVAVATYFSGGGSSLPLPGSGAKNPANRAEAAPVLSVAPISPAQGAPAQGITVAGQGTLTVQPDMAYVSAGVQNRAASAQEAQQENARLMSAVVAKLESMGYADKDLATSGLQVSPVYDRSGGTPSSYQATNQLQITVNDIGQAGAVFDAVVGAGANVAGNIQFGLKDDSSLRLQALRQAVKAARIKADAIAAEMGLQITGVEAVIEQSAGGPLPVVRTMQAADAAMPTPVMPGELTVTASATVVFRY